MGFVSGFFCSANAVHICSLKSGFPNICSAHALPIRSLKSDFPNVCFANAVPIRSLKFDFPNDTPHLDAEQREAYLVQIKERDERVGAQRARKKEERIAKLKEGGEL